jgi:hypothetical protein
VARASLLPVGSAKFGPLVGGLVSPTLVGTRVGAADTALEPCAGRSEHCCEYMLSTLKCRTASYPWSARRGAMYHPVLRDTSTS